MSSVGTQVLRVLRREGSLFPQNSSLTSIIRSHSINMSNMTGPKLIATDREQGVGIGHTWIVQGLLGPGGGWGSSQSG